MSMRLPDFEGWAIFAKVAECGSFARAADEVQLSRPTVSKAVSRLEQTLGVALFNRTSRQLSLTEEGRALLGHASRMLGAAQSAETEAMEGTARLSGPIRLAAPMCFGVHHVAPLLPAFLRQYPGIDILADFSDTAVDLVADGFDLALRIASLADSSLRARKLCPVRLLLVAAPSWLAEAGQPQHPRDLVGCKGFVYTNTTAPGTLRFQHGQTGEDFVLSQAARMRSNNAEAFLPVLREGLGYGLFPAFMVHSALMAGEVEVILPDWQVASIALYLVTPPSPLRSARVNVFMNYLTDRFLAPTWL